MHLMRNVKLHFAKVNLKCNLCFISLKRCISNYGGAGNDCHITFWIRYSINLKRCIRCSVHLKGTESNLEVQEEILMYTMRLLCYCEKCHPWAFIEWHYWWMQRGCCFLHSDYCFLNFVLHSEKFNLK